MRRQLFLDARFLGVLLEQFPEPLARQAFPSLVNEQSIGFLRRISQHETPRFDVFAVGFKCSPAKRDDPLFAAFSYAAHESHRQMDIFHIQVNAFTDAHAGRIKQLQQSAVPKRQCIFTGE